MRSTAKRRRPLLRFLLWLLVLAGFALVAGLVWEARHAGLQSYWVHRYASGLTWEVAAGPSDAIAFPREGPFDKRLGYAFLPLMLERLQERDFVIDAQGRFSPALLGHVERGLFPPYREKTIAGLAIDDCRGAPLYRFSYPNAGYAEFAEIPALIVETLLWIENRGLLDPRRPRGNPAVDWPRLAAAAASQAQKRLELQDSAAGGSTLATQIEKFRHSPDGMTLTAGEKLRQLASASTRAYRDGRNTEQVRREIVRSYLNTVPLSAVRGHGEVHGLADGLRVWFDADFDTVNRLLDPMRSIDAADSERGMALRQVLSLMIAQRRPSYYLAQGRNDLAELVDGHLRLLATEGLISQELASAALAVRVSYRDWQLDPSVPQVEAGKGVTVARRRLSGLLNKPLYDLDRLDLTATSPLHGDMQQAVSRYLARLADPAFAREVGLFGDNMLSEEKTAEVRYSFTLLESDGDRFAVRVQTDNTDQPFDINEDSKLELGSTAKLRVLTTYLEIIAEIFERQQATAASDEPAPLADDPLTRWVAGHLARHPDHGLRPLLAAALERRYSANPNERFFTGGGLHTFGNFRREDNGRNPTLREALRESINLPFVRLLRDIVRYSSQQGAGSGSELLLDDNDPRRLEYLARFADREGTTFLLRFWRKYRNRSADDQIAAFLDGMRITPARLAAVHRYLRPQADIDEFAGFLGRHLPAPVPARAQLEALYDRYPPGKFSLSDQAFLARVHPLELWLLGYLLERPQAGFDEMVADSHEQRQEVYGWLHRSKHRSARDSRVRIMLEVEAFLDIHRRWRRLGYPFGHLVPSLATALGSSGDRPAALAELVGIILNDGVRLPTVRIDALHFAAGTPYETALSRVGEARRVMPAEVAGALREVLSQVVDGGTARRLQGSFALADGSPLVLGGKTGTGDNRIQTVGSGGRLISSRASNRTATFVFFLGNHHFGTLTAYVPGRSAENFRFTSALPVQVLRGMAPILIPQLDPAERSCRPPRDPFEAVGGPR
jgi:membrane peptidoglycan carboxypeptidase